MDNNYELDYKAMFEMMSKMFEKKFETEIEYFDLLAFLGTCKDNNNCNMVCANLMKMSMSDQVLMLRIMKSLYELCDHLVEKYGFDTLDVNEESKAEEEL